MTALPKKYPVVRKSESQGEAKFFIPAPKIVDCLISELNFSISEVKKIGSCANELMIGVGADRYNYEKEKLA